MKIFAAYLPEEKPFSLKTGSSIDGIVQVHSQSQTFLVLWKGQRSSLEVAE